MTGESFNSARRSTGQPLLDIPPPMFSVATNQIESFSNLGRRELLRIGGLTALGLSLPEALQAQQAVAGGTESPGRPVNCKIGRAHV